MEKTRIAVVGAGGRMGRNLIRAISETGGAELSGALEREGSPHVGADCGTLAGLEPSGISVSDTMEAAFADADAVLDFTAPAATVAVAEYAATSGIAHVIGTTGLSADDEAAVAAAARKTAIVKSGNMSMGVILLSVLVEQAARALEAADWDIEVLEMHHRHKVDAPSGTALLLGEAAARGRKIGLEDHSVRVRDGHTGAREPGTIGFATLRGGSVVGDHSVILAGPGERVTLSHHAEDRMIFARGAVRAALWATGRAPGLYSMHDVLGLTG
ncbi:4-hydroxy-tetrahydrodipicolinate reductase [Oricola thermophila]|uniref:4-hydroxy-tetrahydrodipicolinate reductase n=1 Tax=Oricola thermophila TaxID=2742145 RepID=A0A6N1VH21_9HYPH|nr:4-hydroxy-tetrahydrodipicolinate reductase [Oricola thermophila]QKV19773.1 4-hydroxy-tetrahydrodipicolinate reductase [Oricola thermophila]